MADRNRHGLSRDIPDPTALLIRQACGFGCVVCGNALYQYHHVDPPFEDAERHDPEAIALLCGACHDAVTRGMSSNESVARARKNPICMHGNESHFGLDLKKEALTVRFAGITFVNTPTIIQIKREPILIIEPPEQVGAPPRLSARFYDRTAKLVARIDRNEWRGLSTTFDIEAKGKTWKIRSAVGDIDLLLHVEPPHGIAIERLRLHYGGCSVASTSEGGFEAATESSSFKCAPEAAKRVELAPAGIVLDAQGAITIGTDKPLMFRAPPGVNLGPAGLRVQSGGPVELVDAAKDDPRGHYPPGKKYLKVSGNATIQLNVPLGGPPRVGPVRMNQGPKVGRNDPCPCGSKKKFKRCCGA
jgi:hypothetical protein